MALQPSDLAGVREIERYTKAADQEPDGANALARSTLEKRRVPASRATSRDLPRLGGALGSSYGLHVPLGVGNKLVRFWCGATFEHFSGLDANCYLNIEPRVRAAYALLSAGSWTHHFNITYRGGGSP